MLFRSGNYRKRHSVPHARSAEGLSFLLRPDSLPTFHELLPGHKWLCGDLSKTTYRISVVRSDGDLHSVEEPEILEIFLDTKGSSTGHLSEAPIFGEVGERLCRGLRHLQLPSLFGGLQRRYQ